MIFKVLKSSFDGICGGESRYDKIEDILSEISYHKGWPSIEELHKAIKKWAKKCHPGDVFSTQVTAIVAVAVDRLNRQDDECHHCGCDGMDYEAPEPVEGGDIEQKVKCPHCGERWIDVFGLIEQHELFKE